MTFQLQKDLRQLNLPLKAIVHLEQSQGDIQVALPGFPAQMAAAYLVVHARGAGYRVVVGLHLRTSDGVVFYVSPREATKTEVPRLIEAGNHFVESLGFILASLDLMKRSLPEREALWDALPLRSGSSGSGSEEEIEEIEEVIEAAESVDDVVEVEEVVEVADPVDDIEVVELLDESDEELERAPAGEIVETSPPAAPEPPSRAEGTASVLPDETGPDDVDEITIEIEEEPLPAPPDAAHVERPVPAGPDAQDSGEEPSAPAPPDPELLRRRFLEKLGRLLGSM